MSSKRERILQALVAALAPVTGIEGRVYRSQPDPADRELIPCIKVDWTSEQATPETVPQMERTIAVQVAVLVRGDVPDQVADPIVSDAHARIMANAQWGGLAIDTRLDAAAFEVISADNTAAKLTHEYSIKFRHSYDDMTI